MHSPVTIYITFLCLSLCRSSFSSAAGQETLIGIVGSDFILLGADSSVSQSIAVTASNLDKIAVLADPMIPQERHNNPHSQQTVAAAAAGDAADADRLLGQLMAWAAIREYEASVGTDVDFVTLQKSRKTPETPAGMTVRACAELARRQIASQLRSRTPYRVCLLVAGMSSEVDRIETKENSMVFTAQQVQMQLASTGRTSVSSNSGEGSTKMNLKGGLHPHLYWLDEYGSMQQVQYAAHGFASNFIWSILDQGFRADLTRSEALALMRECFAQLRARYVINAPQPPCIKCIDADGCRIVE